MVTWLKSQTVPPQSAPHRPYLHVLIVLILFLTILWITLRATETVLEIVVKDDKKAADSLDENLDAAMDDLKSQDDAMDVDDLKSPEAKEIPSTDPLGGSGGGFQFENQDEDWMENVVHVYESTSSVPLEPERNADEDEANVEDEPWIL